MRLGTSTTMAFNRPNGRKESIKNAVRICGKAGYKVLDMNFHDCAMFPTPLQEDRWEFWVDEIANEAAKYGIEFSQSHLHFYEFIDADDSERKQKEEIIRRCMAGSSMLGVSWAATHAATAFQSARFRQDSLEANKRYFCEKLELADKLNLNIAIENLWDWNIAPKKRYTAQVDELVELVDSLESGRVGICWDFEHASIMEQDQKEALRLIGTRLKSTHVSDQYGIQADHMIPYLGKSSWETFLPVLKEIGYQGDFVYETHRYTQNMPDGLMQGALKFSIEVGEYLIRMIKES